jgi:hypothetical protein
MVGCNRSDRVAALDFGAWVTGTRRSDAARRRRPALPSETRHRSPSLWRLRERPPHSRALQSARRLNGVTYVLSVRRHKRLASEPSASPRRAQPRSSSSLAKPGSPESTWGPLGGDGARSSRAPWPWERTPPRPPSSPATRHPLGRRSREDNQATSQCSGGAGRPARRWVRGQIGEGNSAFFPTAWAIDQPRGSVVSMGHAGALIGGGGAGRR